MALSWKSPEPSPDPFAAVVGDNFLYEVYYARSQAVSVKDIEIDLTEVVDKALPFARAATGDRAVNMLLLWDAVYCTLTIVCSDKEMMEDSSKVVKCGFDSLEAKVYDLPIDEETGGIKYEAELAKISSMIRAILKTILGKKEVSDLPSDMPIYFSDEDRPSVGADFIKNVIKM